MCDNINVVSFYGMELQLNDYVQYVLTNKHLSPRTVQLYKDVLAHIDIPKVETDNMESVWSQLLEGLKKKDAKSKSRYNYTDVKIFMAVISAWLKKNDRNAKIDKRINYNRLLDAIKNLENAVNRQAYKDEELEQIFVTLRKGKETYNGLYNLCLLLLYTGMRIGAAHNIAWSSVRKIDGFPDILTFSAISKGVQYYPICRRDVLDFIKANSFGSDTIIYYDRLNTTTFDAIYRKQMLSALNRAWIETDGHSVFHSFRKSFAQKLLSNPDLEPKHIAFKYLMGHVPKDTTAVKFYILPNGEKAPLDLIKRCANVYQNSKLMKMKIGLVN